MIGYHQPDLSPNRTVSMYSVLMKLVIAWTVFALCVCKSTTSIISHSVVTFFVEETNVFLIKYDKWLVCSTIFLYSFDLLVSGLCFVPFCL